MSTLRACGIAGRVVIVHDMPGGTVISELEREAASVLLGQLQAALGEAFGDTPRERVLF